MLFHGGGNVYSTWFPIDTLQVGSVEVEYNALKAVVYGIMALVAIATTRGRLGYGAACRANRATLDVEAVEAC